MGIQIIQLDAYFGIGGNMSGLDRLKPHGLPDARSPRVVTAVRAERVRLLARDLLL